MTDIITTILMAIFQGIIEWLPISSEGQLSLLFVTMYNMDQVTAVTLALLLHPVTINKIPINEVKMKSAGNIKFSVIITQDDLNSNTSGTAVIAVPNVLKIIICNILD